MPQFPLRPSLTSLRYQARQLLKRQRAGDPSACATLRLLPRFSSSGPTEILSGELVLADAQHALALRYGFSSWPALKKHAEAVVGAGNPAPVSEAQRDEFQRRGLVRLPGLLPQATVGGALDLLEHAYQRANLPRQAEAPDPSGGPDPASKSLLEAIKTLAKQSPVLAALCPPQVVGCAEQLMAGRSLVSWMDRPQILFTPPNAARWQLPHKVWHVDVPRLGEFGCPGVQMFGCIGPIEAGGGGTVVVAGSHRFVNDRGRVRSRDVKRHLRAHAWFDGLLSPGGGDRRRFLERDARDELQVVELTGAAGDVWLTDLRLLHSVAPNASQRPRFMVTQRYFLRELQPADFVDA